MNKTFIADIASKSTNGILIGHYATVAGNYQTTIGCTIIGGPIYKKYFPHLTPIQLYYDSNSNENIIRQKIKQLLNCKRLFSIAQNNTIILQHSALATSLIGILLFKKKQTKLFLITYNNEGYNSWLKKFLYRLTKKKINGIICPNDDVGQGYELPYCTVPDYIYTGNLNNIKRVPYEDKSYDFNIIGRLSPEKQPVEIAKKFANTNYKLLIAGKAQTLNLKSELEQICRNAPNITLKLQYINDEDYYKYIRESRYSILNYSDEYSNRSSGVVYDMIYNGIPVIGRKCKALLFIEENNLGLLYNDLENLDLSIVHNKDMHLQFIKNIEIFCKKQTLYINKLNTFIKQ